MPFWSKSPRRSLYLSLTWNFAAKIPGAFGTFLVLPIVSKELGSAEYGRVLSVLGLGSAATLLFGGLGALVRREMGRSDTDTSSKQSAFVTVLCCYLFGLAAMMPMVFISAFIVTRDLQLSLLSCIPLLCSLFNYFENVRSGFNEHYVTAALQFATQTIIFAYILIFGVAGAGVLVAGSVLLLPALAASILSSALLMFERAYLWNGRVRGFWNVMKQAAGLTFADGLIFATLNLSVFWVGAWDPAAAGTYGTLIRIFGTVITPLSLVLIPLSSHITSVWHGLSVSQRAAVIARCSLVGCAYGICSFLAVSFGGKLYIAYFLDLPQQSFWLFLSVGVFSASVALYRCMSAILFATGQANRFFLGITACLAASSAVSIVSWRWLEPLSIVCMFDLISGAMIVLWCVREALKRIRAFVLVRDPAQRESGVLRSTW